MELISGIPEKYAKATESGDLLFFPSTTTLHQENGVEFEIRLCPALEKKPNLPPPHFDSYEDCEKAEGTKPDPFAPPHNANLLIGELKDEDESEDYVVLFNKYSVVPHHILLVTKEFHSQTAPLLPSDLVQTYKLLLAARDAGRKFFAFYNCGTLSGASQPHKHLQLLPIDPDGPPVERLARKAKLEVPDSTPERPFALSTLPYANHIRRLPSSLSSSTPSTELSHILSAAFMSLLDLAISTIRHDPNYPIGPPSYNVILTLEHMHVIPRRGETYTLHETGEELSVNALGFAGTLLVKSERELEAVRKESIGSILRGVGLESVHDLQVNEDVREAGDHADEAKTS
ncbi:unnamed protein product [Somion occarium]|uniref:ATP adenylyltransferase n=1 Tax=Somion occarium TaxID=3059160 RepID=A0ABP1DJM0_9APHY